MSTNSNGVSSSSASDHLDALKVTVVGPDGADHVLQFQWMRIHPCTAIAESEAKGEESTTPTAAIKVSRMFKQYQQAAITNKQEKRHEVDSKNDGEQSLPASPFLRASGVHVDLCDLFDPPLLSEAYLTSTAVNESGSDEEDDDSAALNGKKVRVEGSGEDSAPFDLRDWFLQVLGRAYTELSATIDNPDAKAVLERTIPDLNERGQISSVDDHASIQKALPLDWVLEQIRGKSAELDRGSEGDLCLLVLNLVALGSASQGMGRYILEELSPVLMKACCGTCTKQTDLYIQRLALALLVQCSLAKLDKTKLRTAFSSTTEELRSEALDELRYYITQQYYRYAISE